MINFILSAILWGAIIIVVVAVIGVIVWLIMNLPTTVSFDTTDGHNIMATKVQRIEAQIQLLQTAVYGDKR